nr:serine/arginine repetitive matrix protein 1-like [Drosophila suzukii]
MSTRETRSEARKMLPAHQPSGGSNPGQGWSTARPTRTSRRISGRGVPEPVISSDSDVELVEDPRVEERRWRLRKAVNRADGRIPTGAAEVEWASEEPPQDQLALSSHAEAVVAATWEFRRKCEARRRNEERRLKEMEESPECQAQLRMAEEEEQQLWENPGGRRLGVLTSAVAARNPAHTAVRGVTTVDTSTTTHAEHQLEREQPPPQHQPPPQQQHERGQPPPQQQPERDRRRQHETDPPQQQHIRTDIPAAHTVVWTWPEGPAEETAATEEPRIWEESGPRVSPLDPRTRGRPEHWAAPTPSTGPTTPRTGPSTPMPTGSATVTAEPDERGPWVRPEPVESGRPPLKRQHSAPEVSEVVSAPEGQRWREIAEHEWPEGIAEAPAVKEVRILGGRRSVRGWREGRAFRVRLGLAGTRVFEERPNKV